MPIRSRAEAQDAFKDLLEPIAALFYEAMDELYDTCGPVLHALEGWTRASLIRDLVKSRLLTLVAANESFHHHRRGNAVSFRSGNFDFRFKKLDSRNRARTSRTKASRAFNQNQLPLLLDDAQRTTNLYLGYGNAENDPRHPPLLLVCNDETGKPAWEPIPVIRAAPPVVDEITPEVVPDAPSGRVKVKGDKARKSGDV